jgi:3-oxosteroid 1-dehydrogenase
MADFDESYDYVVVGSGGGSMCAALVMRSAGKSVLVIEKTDLIGGTTARSGGVMWIPNNRFMKRDGVPDGHEQALTYLDAVIGDDPNNKGATRARRIAYVSEAPRMVDFLVEQGIKLTRASYWPDYYDDRPGGSERGRTVVAQLFDANELGADKARLRPGTMPYMAMLEDIMALPAYKRSWRSKWIMGRMIVRTALARLTGKHWYTAGAALQGRMFQAALKAGVAFRAGTAVNELIVENGAVTGVATIVDGKPVRVGARLGVLVNAGGFSRSQAMRDKYIPGTSIDWTDTASGDTGEMIVEMMRIGAEVSQMGEMVGVQKTLPPGAEQRDTKPGMQGTTAAPHAILVDQSGVRYMNEGGSYMAYCKGMLTRHQTVPALPSWAIMDAQHMRKYMFAGTMPGNAKPQSWYDSGYLRRADTIEELAALIAVDPTTLRATVDRFNGFVAQGRDEDFHRGDRAYDRWLGDAFHKPSATLGTIVEAPFYAVPVVPGDVGTYGGVVTDANARVLREDGTPIQGLYATGVSTASVMGPVYPGAGASVGPSFTWGYVAAKHAANLSNNPG